MILEERMVPASIACRAEYCLPPQGKVAPQHRMRSMFSWLMPCLPPQGKVPEGRMRSMFSWLMPCLPPQGKVAPQRRMRSMFSHPAFFIVSVPPSAS